MLVPILAAVATIVVATLLVKFRTSEHIPGDRVWKFRNPFKNLNLTIALVILGFLLLHTLTFYIELPSDLLFPHMPCGFDMVAMCALFILFNSDAKEHMLRKCSGLRWMCEIGRKQVCKTKVHPQPTQPGQSNELVRPN